MSFHDPGNRDRSASSAGARLLDDPDAVPSDTDTESRPSAASPPPRGSTLFYSLQKPRPDSGTAGVKVADRLQSLDVFRGLAIALMIFVNDAGYSYGARMDHAPWHGVALADFPMPWFLFAVGMAISFSMKKAVLHHATRPAFTRALRRSAKLFAVGLLTQGGRLFSRAEFDVAHVRIMGILQRIAICYLMTAAIFLFLPRKFLPIGPLRHFLRFRWHWVVATLLMGGHVLVMLLVAGHGDGCRPGELTPACNAIQTTDRWILSETHMLQGYYTAKRTPECSSCSPASCPIPGRPAWCEGPFEPEGIVPSFGAVFITWAGVFYGAVIDGETPGDHRAILEQWGPLSVLFLVAGVVTDAFLGMPYNKNLWTPSYNFLMIGTSGLCLCVIYVLVDMRKGRWRAAFAPLKWMGMNAILVYLLAANDIFNSVLRWFYYGDKRDNLVGWAQREVFRAHRESSGVVAYALAKISFWLLVSAYLFKKKRFYKI